MGKFNLTKLIIFEVCTTNPEVPKALVVAENRDAARKTYSKMKRVKLFDTRCRKVDCLIDDELLRQILKT